MDEPSRVEWAGGTDNKPVKQSSTRGQVQNCWLRLLAGGLGDGGKGVLIGRPGDRTNGTGLKRSAIRRATLRMPNASPCLWSWSRSGVGSARIDRDWPTEWTGWTVHTHSRESVDELCGLWAVSV